MAVLKFLSLNGYLFIYSFIYLFIYFLYNYLSFGFFSPIKCMCNVVGTVNIISIA